jgi:hypothetical protein
MLRRGSGTPGGRGRSALRKPPWLFGYSLDIPVVHSGGMGVTAKAGSCSPVWKYRALDHFHIAARAIRLFRTGVLCKYSIIRSSVRGSVMLRSNPPLAARNDTLFATRAAPSASPSLTLRVAECIPLTRSVSEGSGQSPRILTGWRIPRT